MDEFDPPFDIRMPQQALVPLVFNSPHSGTVFPPAFLASSRLGRAELSQSSDLFVDDLLADTPLVGVPLMRAHFPRCFLDVNREPYELDPAMFHGALPAGINSKSLRVGNGYGTIARLVSESQPIYAGKIAASEALRRIALYYRPYHRALERLLETVRAACGHVALIDWHSMPSAAVSGALPADIILGDRNGQSCSGGLIAETERLFRGLGLTVRRNQPYAGGFITEHYGQPVHNVEALQVEINRALYMDEDRQQRHGGFDALAQGLMEVSRGLVAYQTWRDSPTRAAAE